MVTVNEKAPEKHTAGVPEDNRIIEEFTLKLTAFLEKERAHHKEAAEKEAKSILARAYQEAAAITSTTNDQCQLIQQTAREQAEKQAKQVIAQARATVSKDEARRQIEEEVRQDMAAEIKSAQAEAAKILNLAKQEAERSRQQIIEAANAQAKSAVASAEESKRKAEEDARARQAKAQEEASAILAAAQAKADAITRAAAERVSVQLAESTKIVAEIQQKMQQAMGTMAFAGGSNPQSPPAQVRPSPSQFVPEPKPQPASRPPSSAPGRLFEPPPRPHDYVPKAQAPASGNGQTHQGKLKIDIAPPVDNEQVTQFVESLGKTSDLKVNKQGVTEDGSGWVEIEAVSALPLVDILRHIPGVKDVVGAKSYIIVALRAKQNFTSSANS